MLFYFGLNKIKQHFLCSETKLFFLDLKNKKLDTIQIVIEKNFSITVSIFFPEEIDSIGSRRKR